MSKSAPWKDLERRHAKRMKGVRLWRPDFSDSQPDGESTLEAWDTKAYAAFSVVALFIECEKKYREFTGKRNFHLCLFSRRHPRAGDFVLVRAARYARLVEIEQLWLGHTCEPSGPRDSVCFNCHQWKSLGCCDHCA